MEKVEIKKSYVLGAGAGLLLWYLMRPPKPNETDIKVKEENKPIVVEGNDNEITKGVRIEDVSLIKINPNISVQKNFKNSEYFGKGERNVPVEHYNNWLGMSKYLQEIRDIFGGAIIIRNGYNVFGDATKVDITPQNGRISNFWTSIAEYANSYPQSVRSSVYGSFSQVKNLVRFDYGKLMNIIKF